MVAVPAIYSIARLALAGYLIEGEGEDGGHNIQAECNLFTFKFFFPIASNTAAAVGIPPTSEMSSQCGLYYKNLSLVLSY